MNVIYIVGASHSGSTLLDMMLNAHPDIISVGELLKLNQVKLSTAGKPKPRKCSCGVRGLLQCEFWTRVNERVKEAHGKSLVDLNVDEYRQCYADQESNSILFQAISEVSGKGFIVDSSKTPHRLKYLMAIEKLNVYPIYLIRHPCGQIASVIARFGLMKSIVYHEVVHSQTRRILKCVPHSIVSYEDLVAEPECTLGRVLEPLGLKFHPQQLQWAEQVKHSFAGNHVRMQAKSELILDERWKYRLSPTQKLFVQIATFLSRRSTPSSYRAVGSKDQV